MTTEEGKKEGTQKAGAAAEEAMPLEMMKMCCSGEGGSFDCATMMKSRMGAMTGMPCCGPAADQSEADRGEK